MENLSALSVRDNEMRRYVEVEEIKERRGGDSGHSKGHRGRRGGRTRCLWLVGGCSHCRCSLIRFPDGTGDGLFCGVELIIIHQPRGKGHKTVSVYLITELFADLQ